MKRKCIFLWIREKMMVFYDYQPVTSEYTLRNISSDNICNCNRYDCMTQYSYIFIAFASTRIIKWIPSSSPKNIFSIPSIFLICIVVWNYINVYRDQTKPILAIMKANNQTWPRLSEIIFHHRYYFENLKLKIVGHSQLNQTAVVVAMVMVVVVVVCLWLTWHF